MLRAMSDTPAPKPGPRKPGPKPATAERLEKFALFHLERFASSAENLRRVLMRRVQKSAQVHGTDPTEGAAAVEALVQRFTAAGMLDDKLYAEARTASLHRRGASARQIAASLAQKGIDRDLIGEALDVDDEDSARPGGDLAAAAALARRRRLGPYRPADKRPTYWQKDLATFARAGFTRLIAETVLGAENPEELIALVNEGRG